MTIGGNEDAGRGATSEQRHAPSHDGLPLFEMRGISKAYGGVQALTEASLSCRAGEVHGLVGQNGAGKSTLIKIVSGAVLADAGEILHRGRSLKIRSPREAWQNSIGTVFQELSLVGDLSVGMNLLYGTAGIARWGRIDLRRLNALAREKLASVGLPHLDPRAPVRSLSLSDRQTLEIAKVVLRKPTLLVLDEATSALHPAQVEWLHGQAISFAAAGGAVVFVSHRMQEVMAFSHRLTVFRGGRDVGTGLARDFKHDDLIELMLGRRIDSSFPPKPAVSSASPALGEVRDLASGRRLRGIDLDLHAGQILGIAGLQGQGQRDLFMALFGARPMTGRVRIAGNPVTLHSPAQAIRAGVAFIPEDRATEGLFQTLSIKDNIVLGNLGRVSRWGTLLNRSPRRLVDRMIALLDVKLRSPLQEVRALSGGNQQKVLLARSLAQDPRVLLMYDPTRGVDVGTKTEIYRLMREQCSKGVAVMFYSSDAAELAGVCDRVVVLHEGRIEAELHGGDLTEEEIVRAMVGRTGSHAAASVAS
jgi:ribose transport system ATP-binding protein